MEITKSYSKWVILLCNYREESIQSIEAATPTSKTMLLNNYLDHVQFVGNNFLAIRIFYNATFNKLRLYSYGGRQKALSEVITVLF